MTHLTSEQLSARFSGELSPSEMVGVERHLQECLACQADFEGLSRTIKAVQALPRVSAPPDLARNIRLRIHGTGSKTPLPLWENSLHSPPPRWGRVGVGVKGSWEALNRWWVEHPYALAGAVSVALVMMVVFSQRQESSLPTPLEILKKSESVQVPPAKHRVEKSRPSIKSTSENPFAGDTPPSPLVGGAGAPSIQGSSGPLSPRAQTWEGRGEGSKLLQNSAKHEQTKRERLPAVSQQMGYMNKGQEAQESAKEAQEVFQQAPESQQKVVDSKEMWGRSQFLQMDQEFKALLNQESAQLQQVEEVPRTWILDAVDPSSAFHQIRQTALSLSASFVDEAVSSKPGDKAGSGAGFSTGREVRGGAGLTLKMAIAEKELSALERALRKLGNLSMISPPFQRAKQVAQDAKKSASKNLFAGDSLPSPPVGEGGGEGSKGGFRMLSQAERSAPLQVHIWVIITTRHEK